MFYSPQSLEKLLGVIPALTLALCQQIYAIYPELNSTYCRNSALTSAAAITVPGYGTKEK